MRWMVLDGKSIQAWFTWACLGCLLFVGCGGKAVTETETENEPPDREAPTAPGEPDATGRDPDQTGTGRDLDPTIELGDCKEGWSEGEAPCPWLATNGVCYSRKEDACACICPSQGMTVCSSGLPGGEDDRVRVSCL